MKHIIEFISKIYIEFLNIYKELLSTLNVRNLCLDLTKSKINFIVTYKLSERLSKRFKAETLYNII